MELAGRVAGRCLAWVTTRARRSCQACARTGETCCSSARQPGASRTSRPTITTRRNAAPSTPASARPPARPCPSATPHPARLPTCRLHSPTRPLPLTPPSFPYHPNHPCPKPPAPPLPRSSASGAPKRVATTGSTSSSTHSPRRGPRLQPLILEAATPYTRGCSPVHGYSRLQPHAPRSYPSRSLAGRARACSIG